MSDKKQLKEAIKREYAKCATDPVYFLGKYGIIQHPVRGKVNFNLYDFQEKSLESFIERPSGAPGNSRGEIKKEY